MLRVLFAVMVLAWLPLLAEAETLTGGTAQVHVIKIASKTHRSSSAKRAFRAQHPCPGTGQTIGACPGYVIDHISPLCAGGADLPSNMQWQTSEAGKAKDKLERRECSRKR